MTGRVERPPATRASAGCSTTSAYDGRAADALGQLDRLLLAGEQPIGVLAQLGSTLRKFSAAATNVEAAERMGQRPSLSAALKAAGKTGSSIHVYPDADHGFHADYRPSYNEVDAKDGWARLLAHFKANGVA